MLAAALVSGCQRAAEREVDRGNAAASQGKLEAARDAYEAAAAAEPGSSRARALLGQAELSLGHRAEAAKAFDAALAANATDAVALLGRAHLALEARDAGAALTLLTRLPAEATVSAEAHLARARALLLRGGDHDAQDALREAEAARALRPADVAAAYLLGSCQIALGRFSDAQGTFDALERAHPQSAFGPYGLARLAAAQGRATDAILHLKAARASQGPWSADTVALDPAFAFLSGEPAFQELLKTSP